MASARPVIVIKHGGPAEIVDDSLGHAIEPLGPDFVISELAKTLQQIISHPDAWQQKGLNGRIRAEQRFGWDRKIDAALEIYARVTRANSRDATLPEAPLATQTSFHIQTKTEKAL
jgi:glycosyltransferase involved in cell wall biosynthesis